MRIGDRSCRDLHFRYLEKTCQFRRIARKPGDAAIGVLKHYEVKLAAAPGNFSENLTDARKKA